MMFYVPMLLTNTIFLFTAYFTGIQYVRLVKQSMPGQIQLGLVVFCVVMMAVTAFDNRANPWLSLLFFAIAVASALLMLRNRRHLPPLVRRV